MTAQRKSPGAGQRFRAFHNVVRFPDRRTDVQNSSAVSLSMQDEAVTREDAFEEIPVIGKALLTVNADIPVSYALSHATCIVEALKEMTRDGAEHGISATTAWLMDTNLDTVMALLGAVEKAGRLVSARSAA